MQTFSATTFLKRLATLVVAVVLPAVLMAGCGALTDDEPEVSSKARVTQRVDTRNRYPQKGDNKPHPGVARARGLPIHGIDVARYQTDVDWAAVKKAGTRFAWIKSTEGGDYVDPYFRRNWAEAKRNGVKRGAYHFVYWCRPAAEQAAWFVRNVPKDPDALPPVLDLEWNSHSRNCTRRVSREDALAKTRILLAAMERHTGKLPVIYTDINFHRDVLEGVELPNPFWLRATAAEPHERYRDRRWTFWQWTQTGTVPGIRGEVDRNVFYGNDSEWQTFVSTGCDPRMLGSSALRGRCGKAGKPVSTPDTSDTLLMVEAAPAEVAPAIAAPVVQVAAPAVAVPITPPLLPVAPPLVTAAVAPRQPVMATAYDDPIGAMLDALPPGD